MLGLEQVDVERVLEVGGRVRRDHERRAVGAQHAGELDHVQRGVHEVLDDVRRDHEVDAAIAQAELGTVVGDEIEHAWASCRRREAAPDGVAAVVGADHEPVGRAEAFGLADAATHVDYDAGTELGDHLPIARVVQREQRIGRGAFHRPLAGELHRVSPRVPHVPIRVRNRDGQVGSPHAGRSAKRTRRRMVRERGGGLQDSPGVPDCPRSGPRRAIPGASTTLTSESAKPRTTSRRPIAGYGGSRSSPGAISTTPRPAVPSSTRRASPRCGRKRASRSRCARRTPRGTRR